MRTRGLKESDLSALRAMEQASGFPYPALTGPLEAVVVVVDEDDRPIMAAGAKKMVEMYLWCGDFHRPLAKVACLRALEGEMIRRLKMKGYDVAECFIHPRIAVQFGRRLERTFQWVKNWPSWSRRF